MLNICSSISVSIILNPPPITPAIKAGRKWYSMLETKCPISEVGTSITAYLNRFNRSL